MRGVIAAIAVLAAMTVVPASAEPVSGAFYVIGKSPASGGGYVSRRTIVDLGSLDLNKPEAAAAALELLKNAAERVCTSRGFVDHSLTAKIQTCEKRALDDALATLNAPEISRLADAK